MLTFDDKIRILEAGIENLEQCKKIEHYIKGQEQDLKIEREKPKGEQFLFAAEHVYYKRINDYRDSLAEFEKAFEKLIGVMNKNYLLPDVGTAITYKT